MGPSAAGRQVDTKQVDRRRNVAVTKYRASHHQGGSSRFEALQKWSLTAQSYIQLVVPVGRFVTIEAARIHSMAAARSNSCSGYWAS